MRIFLVSKKSDILLFDLLINLKSLIFILGLVSVVWMVVSIYIYGRWPTSAIGVMEGRKLRNIVA